MITKENWREYLIMDSRGEGLKKLSQQNTLLVLRFCSKQFGEFTMDDRKISIEGGVWNERPEKRMLSHTDLTGLVGYLEYCGVKSNRDLVQRSIELIAEQGLHQ